MITLADAMAAGYIKYPSSGRVHKVNAFDGAGNLCCVSRGGKEFVIEPKSFGAFELSTLAEYDNQPFTKSKRRVPPPTRTSGVGTVAPAPGGNLGIGRAGSTAGAAGPAPAPVVSPPQTWVTTSGTGTLAASGRVGFNIPGVTLQSASSNRNGTETPDHRNGDIDPSMPFPTNELIIAMPVSMYPDFAIDRAVEAFALDVIDVMLDIHDSDPETGMADVFTKMQVRFRQHAEWRVQA